MTTGTVVINLFSVSLHRYQSEKMSFRSVIYWDFIKKKPILQLLYMIRHLFVFQDFR